jgi:hypothetical protein
MNHQVEILADVYRLILSWPDNKNAPEAPDKHPRRQVEEEENKVSSPASIITDAQGGKDG